MKLEPLIFNHQSIIGVIGLSYKKNIDDIKESLTLVIIDKLLDLRANIQYSAPFFDTIPHTRKYQLDLKSKPLNTEILNDVDIVLLVIGHDDFAYVLIEKEARLIVDSWGRFKASDKIIKA